MGTFIVYEKMTSRQLRNSAKKTIQQVNKWFADNPKRRVCRAELWYDNRVSLKQKTVAEQVNALVDRLIKEGRTVEPPNSVKVISGEEE